MFYGYVFLIHNQNSQIKFLGFVFQIEKFIVILRARVLIWTITLNLVSRQTLANLENKHIPSNNSFLMGIFFTK